MTKMTASKSAGRAALLALGVGLALAGCSRDPVPEAYPAIGVAKVNRVDWQVEQQAVHFGVGSAAALPGELAQLDRFLGEFDPYGARLYVDAAPGVAGGDLAARRTATLTAFAAERGFTVEPLPPGSAVEAPTDPRAAMLYVGRFVVTPPACPDWRKDTASDFTNTGTSNFGCAAAVNFGLMVADPGDLLQGRETGPAEAQPRTFAIQRYRGTQTKQADNQAKAAASSGGVSTTGGSE